jgi:hypothetical protein
MEIAQPGSQHVPCHTEVKRVLPIEEAASCDGDFELRNVSWGERSDRGVVGATPKGFGERRARRVSDKRQCVVAGKVDGWRFGFKSEVDPPVGVAPAQRSGSVSVASRWFGMVARKRVFSSNAPLKRNSPVADVVVARPA